MIELVRNDKLFDIKFIVTDQNGNPVDLTNSTILLKMKNQKTGTSLSTATCTIVNATAGICKYNVENGFLSTAGVYDAELQLTYVSGQVLTSKLENIKILEDL